MFLRKKIGGIGFVAMGRDRNAGVGKFGSCEVVKFGSLERGIYIGKEGREWIDGCLEGEKRVICRLQLRFA